ncbi:signal peptidase I [Candidatus Poribacteria bacterium]
MKAQDKPKKWESFKDSAWWEYIQVFAVAFVLVFGFMRPFVVEAFKIPSASMENTLLIGDRILVAKFIYGIKIPFTDKQILDFHEPEIGDIFVFKPPPEAGKTQNFIKRIVGLEGDVITVKAGKLYRNGEPVPDEYYVKRLLFSIDDFQKELDSKNLSESLRQAFANRRSTLSDKAVVSVQDKGGRWKITDEGNNETYLIRKDKGSYGLNVYISDESYSRRRLPTRRGLQNKSPFTVPPGHVFAMGDNRDMSNDSRAWGPVPVENIKGQAFLKYWSWDSNADWLHKIRYSRVGRVVR